jgi:hypothetical protein
MKNTSEKTLPTESRCISAWLGYSDFHP